MSQPTLSQDTVYLSEIVLDTSVEQSVELDYFLPDYCPNIFKLLKTSITWPRTPEGSAASPRTSPFPRPLSCPGNARTPLSPPSPGVISYPAGR